MSETETFRLHPSITVGNTLGPSRQCSGERQQERAEKSGRSIIDTAISSKPLRGRMGIECVEESWRPLNSVGQ
jgi:hypothetical protein